MAWDEIWEKIFSEGEWGRYPGESLIRFIARNFYSSERSWLRILEVGCGAGANLWYLAREGFNAYGIDGSASAIKKAAALLSKDGLSAELKVGDISSLPYAAGFFDAVIDVECLYANSRKDAEKILAEIKRVLKPQGVFYSRTIADDVHVGKSRKMLGSKEYTEVSDGPLAGRGFARLTGKRDALELYGASFEVLSVDSLITTFNNGAVKLSEWNIECKKV